MEASMIYLLLIFLLGTMTPVQTAANSRLRQSVASPLVASLVSFSVGTIYLAIATADKADAPAKECRNQTVALHQ